MAYEKKPGEFTVFVNDYKQNDRQPDFKGRGKDLNGNDCTIAIWKRTTQGGKDFLSIKIEAERKQETQTTFQRVEDIPDKGAAQRLAAAEQKYNEYLEPQTDDFPF